MVRLGLQKTLWATLLLTGLGTAVAADAPAGYPAELFAPGVISTAANDWTPAFTPDGQAMYFSRSSLSWGFILESHRTGDGWSEPTIAPFSGEYPDSSPAMAPDGSYIVFESKRPATAALAAEQRAKHMPLKTSALWKVARQGSDWGTPERLPDTVNITGNLWKPSVAANGDIYFITGLDGEKNLHLYRSRYRDGQYQQAEPLPFSDGKTLDVDPAVAADGSYLVFSSSGRGPFKDDHEHMYIVFAQGRGWSAPAAICYSAPGGNQSFDDDEEIGPDQKTLYFASDRTVPVSLPKSRAEAEQAVKDMQGWDNGYANVWSMSLSPWLDAARDGKPMPACAAS
jgi:Tol biopolymer transport system component